MSLTCRVQYLNDIDPFAYTTNFPEPPRPPLHTFSVTLPLINQLAAIHRLLRSPHRVSFCWMYVFFVAHWNSWCFLMGTPDHWLCWLVVCVYRQASTGLCLVSLECPQQQQPREPVELNSATWVLYTLCTERLRSNITELFNLVNMKIEDILSRM